jgi:ATP-binding protein involved in chromosome partitioning
MADPRLEVIDRRIAGAKRIVAVSSGKGGVGKSMIATTLALTLRQKGYSVGLLDLDFTSPSTHVILGVEGLQPEEEKGIIPPLAHGLRYMSIVYYAMDEPAPLRGVDVSNAIIELMAITRWGELDYLVIDTPPGIGDATLDMIRLTRGIQFLLVTTPSKVAFETVRKLFELLRGLGVPVIGVVENMVMKPSGRIRGLLEEAGASYLGAIAYDPEIEDALGDVDRLMKTGFAETMAGVASKVERLTLMRRPMA